MSGKIRWRKVRKFYIPRKWHTSTANDHRTKYDYAVLELRRNHRRPYMTPVAFHRSQGSKLEFNGFPGDKKVNTMWHTRCFVFQNWKGYLINRCDVAPGTSGSGSYLFLNQKNYVVRGLVVASVSLRLRKAHKVNVYRFNVVNPLTKEKTRQMCTWMRAGRDCKSFKWYFMQYNTQNGYNLVMQNTPLAHDQVKQCILYRPITTTSIYAHHI